MTDTIKRTCSHGISWNDYCPQCELVSAKEIVAHWGDAVDEARKVIADAEAKPGEALPSTEAALELNEEVRL